MNVAALRGQSAEAGVVDILYLLDRLEEVLTSGSRLPFSSRVLVDEQECLDIVDQIKLALPEELKLARRVMAERDQIVAEANDRAERLVQRAEEQVASRVDDHALAQAAQDRAREILDQVEREAADVRQQADAYAQRVLTSLHNRILRIDTVITEGLEDLSSR